MKNESATTIATLANTTSAPIRGTVVATATAELDNVREIARAPMTLNGGIEQMEFQLQRRSGNVTAAQSRCDFWTEAARSSTNGRSILRWHPNGFASNSM